MDSFGKAQRKELRRLAGVAHERELGTALAALQAEFQEWHAGKLDVHGLSDAIHQFHNGVARDLYDVVDPEIRSVTATFGDLFVDVVRDDRQSLLIFNWCGLSFEAYGATGLHWRTRPVSWDGIKSISLSGEVLEALTWDAPTQKWIAVRVDLQTGRATGGAYPWDDGRSREVLASMP